MAKMAIIVGAGLGGMATAIRLARHGWKVAVLEKNVRVGGKLDCYTEQGFLWDVGPSQITMPFALRELFEYVGHDMENYLELMPIDPMCRYFYPNGTTINAWTDFHHFKIEVARREKDRGEALENFMRYARGIYHLLAETYLFRPPKNAWRHIIGDILKNLHHLPKIVTPQTAAKAISRYFTDPHLRQLFIHEATHPGSAPYRTPAMFNIVPYLKRQNGSWYIRGGIYRLAEALERCARDLQVEFFLNAEVSEITLENKKIFRNPRASGIVTRGGLRLDADVVICNVDVTYAWTQLLHTKHQKSMTRSLERKPFTSSPFIILWGVKRRYSQLAHHNVFFSSDPIAESNDLFEKKRLPTEPTVHVCISARTDRTQAPQGQDNYSVLSHTPVLEPNHSWEERRDSYRNTILERLEKMGLDGLRHEIVCEKVITPSDFAVRTHAYRGSMNGHAVHSLLEIWNRPSCRSPKIDRLYFVGSTTHPAGEEISSALLSAQRVTRTVINDAKSSPL